MKKFRNLSLAALALTATLFVGCFSASGGSDSKNDKQTVQEKNANKRELFISISNFDELTALTGGEASAPARAAEGLNSARTIVDTGYASGDLNFYITGTSSIGTKLNVTDVTADIYDFDKKNPNKGKITLTIDDNDCAWNLKLYACDQGDAPTITGTSASVDADITAIKAKAVLAGTTYIDLYYSTQAYFTLSPNGLGQKAQVNLTLNLADDWPQKNSKSIVPTGYKVSAGIYDMETGAIIDTTKTAINTLVDPITFTNGSTTYTANTAAGSEIYTGTYNFIVKFIHEETKKLYVWSDTIIILPGKGCNATVTIPNVIGKLPKVPENFNAFYKEKSEDVVTDMYEVVFEWEDKSNNETHFEIQMVDRNALAEIDWANDAKYKADTTMQNWTAKILTDKGETGYLTAADIWGAVDGFYDDGTGSAKFEFPEFVEVYGSDFFNEPNRVSGALFANNETVSIYLPLGTSYEARIFAVNEAGKSAVNGVMTACNVALDGTPSGATGVKNFAGDDNIYGTANNGTLYTAGSPATYGVTGDERTNDATTISRFRVRYNLQGGTYDADGPTEADASPSYGNKATEQEGMIVEYYCQDEEKGNYIIYPEASFNEKGDTEGKPVLNFGGSYFYEYWAESLADPDSSVDVSGDDTNGTKFQKKYHVYPSTRETAPTRYEPKAYKGSKNLELYAKYRVEAHVEIIDPTDVAINPVWVSFKYATDSEGATEDGSATALTATTAGKSIDVTKNSAETGGTEYKTMNWYVTIPKFADVTNPSDGSTANFNYTNLTLKLFRGNVVYYEETIAAADNAAAAAPNKFAGVPLSRLRNGMYNLVITAQYGTKTGGTIVSLPLSLNVVDYPGPTPAPQP